MPEQERQRFRAQQNYITISRPVHYSNVQLCVEEREQIDGGRCVRDVGPDRIETNG